jgi:RNA methyltransferase, TrmH family
MRLLTQARDLGRRKARERDGLFVVEGIRGVEELLRSPLEIVGILSAPQLSESPRGEALRGSAIARAILLSDVTDREFASAAQTESPQGVLAIARSPRHSLAELPDKGTLRLLVLDAVQDPGNVGTIVRTAAALGVNATIALPGTVDLWNAKVVRSAMGSHFHHPAFHASWEELKAFCASGNVPLWGADGGGRTVGSVPAPSRLALAVGNEGNGLSAQVRSFASEVVSLPIAFDVESLNVAVAAGILLYQLRP